MSEQMLCPHCRQPAVFETQKPVVTRPTVERWVFDRPVPERCAELVFTCVECSGLVKIDFFHRTLTPLASEPIVNDFVRKVLAQAKQKPKDAEVPKAVIETLRELNFRVSRLCTAGELVSSILEQM